MFFHCMVVMVSYRQLLASFVRLSMGGRTGHPAVLSGGGPKAATRTCRSISQQWYAFEWSFDLVYRVGV